MEKAKDANIIGILVGTLGVGKFIDNSISYICDELNPCFNALKFKCSWLPSHDSPYASIDICCWKKVLHSCHGTA